MWTDTAGHIRTDIMAVQAHAALLWEKNLYSQSEMEVVRELCKTKLPALLRVVTL